MFYKLQGTIKFKFLTIYKMKQKITVDQARNLQAPTEEYFCNADANIYGI